MSITVTGSVLGASAGITSLPNTGSSIELTILRIVVYGSMALVVTSYIISRLMIRILNNREKS